MYNKRIKANLILSLSINTNQETLAHRSFMFLEFEAGGVRKFATWITDLWQKSVYSDIDFWFLCFNIRESYSTDIKFKLVTDQIEAEVGI